MATSLFSKLWPLEAKFFMGEQPTPTKLNGIFNQLASAMFMIESFLGNGTDYEVIDNSQRKMLFNLSNALGSTEKLYKPLNKITTLEYVNRLYGKTADTVISTYDRNNDILIVNPNTLPITIPVNGFVGNEFGIFYKGSGTIENLNGDGNTFTLDVNTEYGWSEFTLTGDTNYIRIKCPTGGEFKIKSLYLTDTIRDNAASKFESFNKGYSLPTANANYYTLKTPCKYSNPQNANNANICESATCDYCIGNTYVLDSNDPKYGTPLCQGALNKNGDGISYESETQESSPYRASYLTIQSPVITVSMPYQIKYKPVATNDYVTDMEIPQNKCIVYDALNPGSTIKYTTALFSAGRSDIFYVKDTDVFLNGLGNSKRYMVLGDYGVIDMIHDLTPYMGQALPIDSFPVDIAIYADDNGN